MTHIIWKSFKANFWMHTGEVRYLQGRETKIPAGDNEKQLEGERDELKGLINEFNTQIARIPVKYLLSTEQEDYFISLVN